MDNNDKFLTGLIILFFISLAFFIGVIIVSDFPDRGTPVKQEIATYKIVDIDPPKHFYIDLEKDGIVHNHVYVSKHFNNWREIPIGSEIQLTVRTLQFKDGRTELEFLNVRDALEGLLINKGK